MNWLDAQLTILWVRLNVATEGNGLMATLLNQARTPFLSVKLLIGAFAAYILYRFAEIPLARRGMKARARNLFGPDDGSCCHRFSALVGRRRDRTFLLWQPARSFRWLLLLIPSNLAYFSLSQRSTSNACPHSSQKPEPLCASTNVYSKLPSDPASGAEFRHLITRASAGLNLHSETAASGRRASKARNLPATARHLIRTLVSRVLKLTKY